MEGLNDEDVPHMYPDSSYECLPQVVSTDAVELMESFTAATLSQAAAKLAEITMGMTVELEHDDAVQLATPLMPSMMTDDPYGCARGSLAVSKTGNIFYYETKYIRKVEDGSLSVGLATLNHPLDKLCGQSPHSVSLHSSGSILCEGKWIQVGSPINDGSVISISAAVINDVVWVAFYIDGELLKVEICCNNNDSKECNTELESFDMQPLFSLEKDENIFPCISLHGAGTVCETRFHSLLLQHVPNSSSSSHLSTPFSFLNEQLV